ATQLALATFQQTSRRMPAFRRAELLRQLADRVDRNRERLVQEDIDETGKLRREAHGEVDRTLNTLRFAAEEALRIPGEVLSLDAVPQGAGYVGRVTRFPLGPILGITPFNYPLLLSAHKLGPAIAAGNTVVIKPASKTPLTSLTLGELASEAGFPPGMLSVLPCSGQLAETLVRDERYQAVSFTGSADVGWRIKASAGRKRVTLELGGNGAVIVHHDADVKAVAARMPFGGFLYGGQNCISVQRVYVHRRVHDAFLSELTPLVRALKIGDPNDDATTLCPLIDQAAVTRIMAWLDEARAMGATLATGGVAHGPFIEPTIVTNATQQMRIVREEVFGPVVVLIPYDTIEEAIALVNDSEYGLQAGLFTNDVRVIERAYRDIDVGGLIVNDTLRWRVDHMPYGGVKRSGFGREGLKYAIEEMTEAKLLVVNAG
ncbi:MAG: aldehyde dehydrogenase family protein, partial [Actinobacteria bacterium]|nr:aldehyde dehydrogenase family protein [Actinomycetota bacterium]